MYFKRSFFSILKRLTTYQNSNDIQEKITYVPYVTDNQNILFFGKNLWFMKWWTKTSKEIMENDNGKNPVNE